MGEAKVLRGVDDLVCCNPEARVVGLLGGVSAGDLSVDA